VMLMAAKFGVPVCPHAGGARSWIPSAYNPETKILYSPLVESCMDLIPTGPGERGFLTTGVRVSLRPRLDSDGQYGRIQATNLETRQTVFIKRQRAPETSGILATAGGLIFSGSIDRWFSAHNDQTGEERFCPGARDDCRKHQDDHPNPRDLRSDRECGEDRA